MEQTAAEKSKEWRKNNPEKVKDYRIKNRDKAKIQTKEWRENNQERTKELGKINYERKKEERKQYQRNYKAEDPEKVRKSQRDSLKRYPEKVKQRHDKRNFNGLRKKALQRDEYKCQKCFMTQEAHIEKWGCDLIVHHKDGNGRDMENPNNTLDNLQTLCKIHHGKEHGRDSSA